MTRFALRALLVLLVASLAGIAFADDDETLTGSFVWTNDEGEETGDLKAVFTKAGDMAWKVTFYFDWEGDPNVWKGTAKGNLSSGKLSGEVTADLYKPVTFSFAGMFKDGTFHGTHEQLREEGKRKQTGTLTLGH